MNRRTMLKYSLGASVCSLSQPVSTLNASRVSAARRLGKPKFKMDLCGGRVGIDANQIQLIELAAANGFSAVEPLVGDLKALGEGKGEGIGEEKIDGLNEKLGQSGLVWSAAGLPVEFRKTETEFQEDLASLPAIATVLQRVGVTRVATWIMPCHETETYRANFQQHATRLKQAAEVLGQHGLRLGLEYVGTKSLWTTMRFPFIHTMAETKELLDAIGQDNVGFVLDSWHWTMAEETADDIRSLTNDQIVAVDLNDAPAGIGIDQQVDSVRELPMATGTIDMKGFLQALVDVEYDGPVRAEPFNKTLNEMDNESAAKATAESMKKALATVS